MITETQEEKLIKRITDRINKANEYFLKNIGEYIKEIKGLSPTKAHQLVQILKYGGDYKRITKELEKSTNINVKELETIFEEYAKKDAMFYEQFYQYRGKPFDENLLGDQLKAISRVSQKTLYDYTRPNVLGFSLRDANNNVVKFLNLKETYNMVLEQALLNVSEGKENFNKSMRGILEEIGKSGLRKVDYESGRSYRLDSIVRMHLKDSLRDLHNRSVELYGEDFGADGYEVSVHRYPAIDHEEVQGRQFYIKEYEKLQEIGIAKDVKGRTIDITIKGNFRPISTMNCYHYIFPIVVGVSAPEYTEEQLRAIREENNKGFEYEGRHYSMYEGTQLQREIERNIREQKDIQIMARASGDDELASITQGRINLLSKKYKEVSDVSGLPTQKDRLSVKGYHPIKVREASVPKAGASAGSGIEVFISKEENKALASNWLEYYKKEEETRHFLRPFEKERYEKMLAEQKAGYKDETIKLDSIEDCNRLLEKVNTEITGDDIKNTDIRLVAESSELIYKYSTQAPSVMDDLTRNRAWLQAKTNTDGVANTMMNRITLNNQYFSDYDKFLETCKDHTELHDYLDGKKHSWWSTVAGGNETKEVVTHEFGHRLQSEITSDIVGRSRGETKAWDYFFKKYGYEYNGYKSLQSGSWDKIKRDLIYEPIRRLQAKTGLTQKEIIDKYVSMYGRKTYQEMFAEVFANSQLGDSNALGDELIDFLVEIGEWKR